MSSLPVTNKHYELETLIKSGAIKSVDTVPQEWRICRLKNIVIDSYKGSGITKDNLKEAGEYECVRYADIYTKYNSYFMRCRCRTNIIGQSPKRFFGHGDVLFSCTGELVEEIGKSIVYLGNKNCLAGGDIFVVKHNQDPMFLSFALESFYIRTQKSWGKSKLKVVHISPEEIHGLVVLLPPLFEQKHIAKYLDWKISEINRLINGYQKQIRLLDEYTLALIDSCVTNGIRNSQKKRVQSNWVSEIPCNWSFDKVKQHFEIRKRIAGKEGYDVISITQQGLKVKNISSNEGQMALDYSKYQFVYPDEFAMNHMDLLTGYIGLSEVFGVTSPDYRVFAALCPDKLNLKYFLYVFQLGYKRKIFYGLGRGAANKGRWRLPAQNFLNYEIPIPPKGEQDEIVEFLDKKLTLTAQAKTSFEKRVNLLKEYKTALISNVVTGQVDVRDVEIPEFETVELTDTDIDVEAEVEG